MTRRLLHIGLPKAGSSLLQWCFDSPETPRKEIARRLADFSLALNGTERLYRGSCLGAGGQHGASLSDEEKSLVDSASSFSMFIAERRLDFVSSEGMCGFSLSPLRSSGQWAKALGVLQGQYDVLLIVRNQVDWSLSTFQQIVQVENRYRRRFTYSDVYGGKGYINFDELNWLSLTATWEEAGFTVRVLPFESLLIDPRAFIGSVEGLLGRKANHEIKSVEPPFLRYARNHLGHPQNLDKYLRLWAKRYGPRIKLRNRPSALVDFWRTAEGQRLVEANTKLMDKYSFPDAVRGAYGVETDLGANPSKVSSHQRENKVEEAVQYTQEQG